MSVTKQLLEAARNVVANWATGDLAGAVRRLDAAVQAADAIYIGQNGEEDGPDEPEEDFCRECSASLADGEGWNGLCGNCADRAVNPQEVDKP